MVWSANAWCGLDLLKGPAQAVPTSGFPSGSGANFAAAYDFERGRPFSVACDELAGPQSRVVSMGLGLAPMAAFSKMCARDDRNQAHEAARPAITSAIETTRIMAMVIGCQSWLGSNGLCGWLSFSD